MRSFDEYLEFTKEYGYVKEMRRPIVKATGLPSAKVGEILMFDNGETGVVLSLDNDLVEIESFTSGSINPGQKITRTGEFLSLRLAEELLGRIVDPLGRALVGAHIDNENFELRRVDTQPTGIMERSRIDRQLLTGVSLIDVLLPLGMGQRELIVGDRKTGKTHSIINIVKKQVEVGSVVVYALIGKERSEIRRIEKIFLNENLMDSSVIVASSAADSPSLIDLTPYSAMTVAEYFRDLGRDVLIVFDDLTNHAKFYREVALVAGRFPGRDSYPGDIFYKHARLLERGGSFRSIAGDSVAITCLPIAESLNKRLSDYIISNLIGITDGHLLFDEAAFNEGRRPAIDIFLSVTRVGKQTQKPIMRSLNGSLYKLMARYQKAVSFKHFGAELSDRAKKMINRGDKVYNFFTQNYRVAIPENVQILMLVMIIGGLFDEIDAQNILSCRDAILESYQKSDTRKQIDDVVNSSDTVKELVERVKGSKINLLELCKIQKS